MSLNVNSYLSKLHLGPRISQIKEKKAIKPWFYFVGFFCLFFCISPSKRTKMIVLLFFNKKFSEPTCLSSNSTTKKKKLEVNFYLPGPDVPIGSDQCPEGFTQVFLNTVVKIHCPESVIVENPLYLSQESGFKF
jgi:hypothetical protein